MLLFFCSSRVLIWAFVYNSRIMIFDEFLRSTSILYEIFWITSIEWNDIMSWLSALSAESAQRWIWTTFEASESYNTHTASTEFQWIRLFFPRQTRCLKSPYMDFQKFFSARRSTMSDEGSFFLQLFSVQGQIETSNVIVIQGGS